MRPDFLAMLDGVDAGDGAGALVLDASVRGHIRELVLAAGGVSENEAAVLMRVLARLAEIQAGEGVGAAAAAAREVKDLWLASRH